MTRVLVVATYPIKNAQHGGQRRVSAIVEAYRNIFTEARFVSVFPPDYYQHYSKTDIAVRGKTRKQSTDSPYTGDITCGLAIYEDPYVKQRFTKLLKEYQPDILQIEQVFPYLGIKPLLKELGMSPKIILSSHNIEYTQKLEILENSGFAHEAKDASKIIKVCETDMAKNADLTVAVSQDDADKLIQLGGKNVVVAPNGIEKLQLSESSKDYWSIYKQKHALRNFVTFVGSAHPPNWHGFLAMVGEAVGFVPPDTRLVLAGSISDYFKDNIKDLTPEHATFWNRVIAAGRLSDDRLTGLINSSEVLLLPITEGGGSNLKTAEAILSGKKIVATSYAFRSFEQYLDLPNIYMSDSPDEYKKLIVKAVHAPYEERTIEQIKLAEQVQWKYCLKPMLEGAKGL